MQKLTTKTKFHEKSAIDQYKQLHETELRVKMLERFCEGFLFWEDGSPAHNDLKKQFIEYMEGVSDER